MKASMWGMGSAPPALSCTQSVPFRQEIHKNCLFNIIQLILWYIIE